MAKRNKWGQKFDFVRFLDISNKRKLEYKLNQIRIRGSSFTLIYQGSQEKMESTYESRGLGRMDQERKKK